MFYIVEPYVTGPTRYQQATIVSEHVTAEAAYAELDRIAETLAADGNPSDALELHVVDDHGELKEDYLSLRERNRAYGLLILGDLLQENLGNPLSMLRRKPHLSCLLDYNLALLRCWHVGNFPKN
jgi:hypothetical protein